MSGFMGGSLLVTLFKISVTMELSLVPLLSMSEDWPEEDIFTKEACL